MQKTANEQIRTGKDTDPHQVNLQKWWKYTGTKPLLIRTLSKIDRYIACPETFKKPIFEFISSKVRPDTTLKIIVLEDDYSFGIIQSKLHCLWIKTTCSTLGEGYRYTTSTVFNTFPWPQTPTQKDIEAITTTTSELRTYRNKTMIKNNWGLRKLYQTLDTPGKNPLREHHKELDLAVCKAYGFNTNKDLLTQLIKLNIELVNQETKGTVIVGPGYPYLLHKII